MLNIHYLNSLLLFKKCTYTTFCGLTTNYYLSSLINNSAFDEEGSIKLVCNAEKDKTRLHYRTAGYNLKSIVDCLQNYTLKIRTLIHIILKQEY